MGNEGIRYGWDLGGEMEKAKKVGECGNVSLVLEEEIKEAKKLAELQRSSKKNTRRDPVLLKGEGARPSSNFDKQATLLQKQLEEIGGLLQTEKEMAFQVENLRRKMEGLPEGRLVKKMKDEYGPMLSRPTNTSAANSASSP